MATGLPESFVDWATGTIVPIASIIASIALRNPSYLSILAWDSGFKGLSGILEQLSPKPEGEKIISDKDMKMLYDRAKTDPQFLRAKEEFNTAVNEYNKAIKNPGASGALGAVNDILSILTLGIYSEKRRGQQKIKETGKQVEEKFDQVNKALEKVDSQMTNEAYDIAGQIKL